MGAERRLTAARIDRYFRADEPDTDLEALADHCIAAKKLADRVGTHSMQRLTDLLLFEVGRALAERGRDPDRASKDDPA